MNDPSPLNFCHSDVVSDSAVPFGVADDFPSAYCAEAMPVGEKQEISSVRQTVFILFSGMPAIGKVIRSLKDKAVLQANGDRSGFISLNFA